MEEVEWVRQRRRNEEQQRKSPGRLRWGIGTDCYPLTKRVKYGIAIFEGRIFRGRQVAHWLESG